MAAEQRAMVSPHIKEQIQDQQQQQQQQQQQPKTQRSRKIFSVGEKFLFVLFTAILVLFATMILHNESQLNDVNREIQALNGKIEEQAKQNTELSIQVQTESSYDKVWRKAKELGLNLNKNVKVVPGR